MKVTQAPQQFRPVSVTFETQDEFDQFAAVLAAVASNKIHHSPTLIRAAIDLSRIVHDAIGAEYE